MSLKAFMIGFVLVYLLISLPAILGIGYVIDWVPEATLFQKFKGYVVNGLLNNFLIKILIASIVGVIVSFVIARRRLSNLK
jgi:type III secretory pathway component EscS